MEPGPAKAPPTVPQQLFVATMHGIRGAAVLVVVLFHVAGGQLWEPSHGFPRAIYESGFLAVDVLFFTTGFVLFLPVVLSGRFGSVGSFAIRRFARIGPPYYVCIVLVAAFYPLISNRAMANAFQPGPTDFLVHFAFLQTEIFPLHPGFLVNAPVWTLSIDAAFYVLLPLIATAYLRRPLVGLGVALAATMAWRFAFIEPMTLPTAQHHLGTLIQLPLFLGDFAGGMTAAWAYARLKQRPAMRTRTTVGVTLGALAALLVLAYVAGKTVPYRLGVFQEPGAVAILFPLAMCVFAVAVALCPPWTQWPLTNRALLWFSEISYSVYLYHYPIIFFGLFTLGIERNGRFPLPMAAAVLPACIAISVLSYFFVEQPARRYGRRLASRFGRGGPMAPTGAAADCAAALGSRPSGGS